MQENNKLNKIKITERAVLYVGFHCNAKCKFCYYRYMKGKKWRSLDEVKREAKIFRFFYKNKFVDITGGEPTIYPHILELVKYCNEIGLKPTVITNSFILADREICKKFKENGINDFLVSIYGIGDSAEKITEVKDAYNKQLKALDNLVLLQIPFRINVTVHKFTINQLPQIAELAVQKRCKIINMIIFNPFYEWDKFIKIDFQGKYLEMAPYIKSAIRIMEENQGEANVRYIPFCVLKGFEKNIYNFMQLSYDQHEWDFNSWGNNCLMNPKESWYEQEAKRRRIYDCKYKKSESCKECSLNYICDGFHNQYASRFGYKEMEPYKLYKDIKDTGYFIKNQKKQKYEEISKLLKKPSIIDKDILILNIKCLLLKIRLNLYKIYRRLVK